MKLLNTVLVAVIGSSSLAARAGELLEHGSETKEFFSGAVARILYRGTIEETWVVAGWPDPLNQMTCNFAPPEFAEGVCFGDPSRRCISSSDCPAVRWDHDDPVVAAPVAPAAGVARVVPRVADWCGGFERSPWEHTSARNGIRADDIGGYGGLRNELLGNHRRESPPSVLPHAWPELLPMRPASGYYRNPIRLADYGESTWRSMGMHREEERAQYRNKYADPIASLRELQAIAVAGCDRAAYGPRQRRVANWLQQWLNRHPMPVSELNVLLAQLVADPSAVPESRTALFDTVPPALQRLLWGEFGSADHGLDLLDRMERQAKPDPVARLSALMALADGSSLTGAAQESGQQVAAYELSTADWAPVTTKLQGRTAVERFVLQHLLPELAARGRGAKPGVEAAFVAARTEYEAMADRHPELVATVTALRDDLVNPDGSPKGPSGAREQQACAAALDVAWAELFASRAPKSIPALRALTREPAVDFLYRAISTSCPQSRLHSSVAGPRFRQPISGPRTYFAVHADPDTTKQAQGPAPFEDVLFLMSAQARSCPPQVKSEYCAVAFGQTIRKVKQQADGILVDWAPVSWVEEVEKCKTTNRIDRINERGEVFYQEDCRVVGKRPQQRALPPTLLPRSLAPALRPGRVVRFLGDPPVVGLAPASAVVAVFPDGASARSSTKHVVIFGSPTAP